MFRVQVGVAKGVVCHVGGSTTVIMDEGLCNAEVIDGRGSLTCWLWLCEGLRPKHMHHFRDTHTIHTHAHYI